MIQVAECQRHFPFGPESTEPTRGAVYYTQRCSHIGDRFVVEIRSVQSGFITVDYVQEARPGESELIVEGYEPTSNARADTLWHVLVERMQQNDPPSWHD